MLNFEYFRIFAFFYVIQGLSNYFTDCSVWCSDIRRSICKTCVFPSSLLKIIIYFCIIARLSHIWWCWDSETVITLLVWITQSSTVPHFMLIHAHCNIMSMNTEHNESALMAHTDTKLSAWAEPPFRPDSVITELHKMVWNRADNLLNLPTWKDNCSRN